MIFRQFWVSSKHINLNLNLIIQTASEVKITKIADNILKMIWVYFVIFVQRIILVKLNYIF